ncbi:hypothetical protein BCV70DRAFT_210622 [Testicularia cyperi]|uniref:Uncharacterized protein n=1 Tax=Testicularia cyperi TaxID=1882483 RepID=A0A317XSX2_9BASI|nr:hypothetical protein BCV70DRAFT_210622 [Testicularia cyperi]
MAGARGNVIDLTAESPPAARNGSRSAAPSSARDDDTAGMGTHITDWSRTHSNRTSTSTSAAASTAAAPRHTQPGSIAADDAIVVSSDEEDDGDIAIVRESRSHRHPDAWHSHFLAPTRSSARDTGSMRFHDGIGQGPHGGGSRIPQSIGVLSSSGSAARQHPFHGTRHTSGPGVSIPAMNTRSAAMGGGGGAGRFVFGSFGTTFGMELIGNYLQNLRSARGNGTEGPHAAPPIPQKYDPKWTHPFDAQPNFVHSIIEPPIEVDTYFDDKNAVSGPLPDTTPICAGCRRALVTGGTGETRMWALPCGHVIDGRCVDLFSGLSTAPSQVGVVANDASSRATTGPRKGKAKAVEPPDDEPPAKMSRTSGTKRTRAKAAAAAATASSTSLLPPPPPPPPKPRRFECPVHGCGQKCTKEQGSKYSAWQIYV